LVLNQALHEGLITVQSETFCGISPWYWYMYIFCPVKSVNLFYKYRYSKYIYRYFADLPFYLTEWYCQYQRTSSDTEDYQPVWCLWYWRLLTSVMSLILKIINQCDVSDTEDYQPVWCQTHYDVTDKNNNVSFEAHPIRLAEILAIMSVSTFITAIILYVTL
jgi:hypothetical protein